MPQKQRQRHQIRKTRASGRNREETPVKIEIEVQDEQEAQAIRLLIRERRRQDSLFGKQDHDPAWWMVIMGEEYGEACKAVCDYKWGADDPRGPSRTRQERIAHAVTEATQVGAVAVAMMQSIARDAWTDEISTVTPSDKRQVAVALGMGDEDLRYDSDAEQVGDEPLDTSGVTQDVSVPGIESAGVVHNQRGTW